MTASSVPDVAVPEPAAAGSNPPDRARRVVLATALGLGALTVAGLLVNPPWGERNATGYESVAPVRDAAWAGLLADGIAFAVVGFTLALTVLGLVRQRGRVLALIGAVLAGVGALLFAMGSYAFVSLAWYATSTALPAESGKALISYAVEHPEHGLLVTMAGFLLYTVGTLVLGVAVLRGRAAPVAAVVAFLALTVSQFVGIDGRALDFVQIGLMILLAGLAGWSLRRR